MNRSHLTKTEYRMIFADNNMKSLNIILVLTVLLFDIKFAAGGKSDEKCNEYIQLSRQRRDDQGVNNLGKVEVSAHEFPHMAAIYDENNDIRCGGSLISEQYVVTVAHCLRSTYTGTVQKVRMGDLNLASSADDADVQEFTVVSAITHPDYDFPKVYNDIGLVKLDRPVNVTRSVRPACLQVTEQIGTDKAVAAGWGALNIGDPRGSDKLMKVELDLYTNEECSNHYNYRIRSRQLPVGITNNLICAGGKTEPKNTCKGDSGGPLQILRAGNPYVHNIIGVLSFGVGCGKVNSPEAATRVSSYVPWLESVVWA